MEIWRFSKADTHTLLQAFPDFSPRTDAKIATLRHLCKNISHFLRKWAKPFHCRGFQTITGKVFYPSFNRCFLHSLPQCRFGLCFPVDPCFGFGEDNIFRLTEYLRVLAFRLDGRFRHEIQREKLIYVLAVNRAVYKKGFTTVRKPPSAQFERRFVYFCLRFSALFSFFYPLCCSDLYPAAEGKEIF